MGNDGKVFWRAKPPRFHTKPFDFSNIQIVINSQPYSKWLKIRVLAYLKHALSVSEVHLAVAKSLEIIDHLTNCCKKPFECCIHGFSYILYFHCYRKSFYSYDGHYSYDGTEDTETNHKFSLRPRLFYITSCNTFVRRVTDSLVKLQFRFSHLLNAAYVARKFNGSFILRIGDF